MDLHGEAVLRQRACVGCRAVFWICGHCDRGQRYCSPVCRTEARRGQRRRANCRHQRSPEGRLDPRDRQREYRRRRADVTDQGSHSISSSAVFDCGLPESPQPASVRRQSVARRQPNDRVRFLRCIVCGRSSRRHHCRRTERSPRCGSQCHRIGPLQSHPVDAPSVSRTLTWSSFARLSASIRGCERRASVR